MLNLEIIDVDGKVRQGRNDYENFERALTGSGTELAYIATQNFDFAEGDVIVATVDRPGYYWLKLDATLDSSLVYIKDAIRYPVTLTANAQDARPQAAFQGQRHYLVIRRATAIEIAGQQNLALNPHDQKEANGSYPHAFANVETRNDATFFACNAINGILANQMHGEYPYQSWGINQQADAKLTIDFGREVELNGLGVVLRADFPHDSFWTAATVTFSDGSQEVLHFEKKTSIQRCTFSARRVRQLSFSQLQKHADQSPFPALTELECYGRLITD